jgi:ribonuclease G
MIDQEILVDRSPGETRAAILSQGRLEAILIERAAEPSLLGAIVLAPVTAVRRELAAVFLDLGDGDGYLDRFSGPLPNQGQRLLVEVTAEAHGAKAARVTTDISLHGAFMTLSPTRPGHAVARAITAKGERRRLRAVLSRTVPEDIGALIHANASECETAALEVDAGALMERWSRLKDRMTDDTSAAGSRVLENAPDLLIQARRLAPSGIVLEGRDGALFRDREIDAEIALATERRVDLPSGAALVIDETEALVAIDVDIARATNDNPTALANEVAVEIARQTRLRRLAGLILIDFPRGGPGNVRRALVTALEGALASDPDQPTIHGWTRGGLLELTRPRRGRSLREILRTGDRATPFSPTTQGLEALRRVLRETSGIPHPRLICPNPVKLALQGPLRKALEEVEHRLGGRLTLEVGTGQNEIEIAGG